MSRLSLIGGSVIAALFLGQSALAQEQESESSDQMSGADQAEVEPKRASIKLGTLRCEQSDRTNIVVWSQASYNCTFSSGGDSENYTGQITRVGADLSSKKAQTLYWIVLASAEDPEPGALEGSYFGVSADAALGIGAGVHALVGGGKRSITLQPISASTERGFGLAVGVEQFDLTAEQSG